VRLPTFGSKHEDAFACLRHSVSCRVRLHLFNLKALRYSGAAESIEDRSIARVLDAWHILENETVRVRFVDDAPKLLDEAPSFIGPRFGGCCWPLDIHASSTKAAIPRFITILDPVRRL
jgi:hypothetical protein